ncbi:hypothetical protein AB0C69_07990 [Actinomadura sp. NPDC048032]
MSESEEEQKARLERLAESDRIYREVLASPEGSEAAAIEASEAILPEN